MLYGGGRWDFGLPNASTVAALDQVAFVENGLKATVAATGLNKGNKNALTVKLDHAYKLLAKGHSEEVREVLNG